MPKNILVVDDHPVMLKYMQQLLEREGHRVEIARDGYDALDLLVTYAPDIMFIDLIMPKIGGDKLCRIVRRMPHLKHSYLVIVSAAVAELASERDRIGADLYIAKGSFKMMSGHILEAIRAADAPHSGNRSRPMVGTENDQIARRMTRELLSHARRLETILESIDQGILEVFSGKVVYANSAALDLFGVFQEELLARYVADLFEPVDRGRVKSLLSSGGGRPDPIGTNRPLNLKGRRVVLRNFPLMDEASSSIVMVYDVTDQLHNEFQRQHDRKMDAIGLLAGIAGRALHKQTDGMLQITDKLLEEMTSGIPRRRMIHRVGQNLRRLGDLSRQMLLLADAAKNRSSGTLRSIPGGTETILLADNGAITRRVDALILEDLGYTVKIARTGRDAVVKYRARFDKHYSKIDLVILDVDLPDWSPSEICDQLKRINPGVKILLTGEAEPVQEDWESLGPERLGFITKPFDMYRVSGTIRGLLDLTQAAP